MRTVIGLIGYLLVVYGPEICRNPYASFGTWCLASSGDWVYRHERIAYDAGDAAYQNGFPRRAPSRCSIPDMWLNGWDDAASHASLMMN